jgi:hypothetical protein
VPSPTKLAGPCSQKGCRALGWTPKPFGDANVCAGSSLNGTCSGVVSFEEARSFCQRHGARLCEVRCDAREGGKGRRCDAREGGKGRRCDAREGGKGRREGG